MTGSFQSICVIGLYLAVNRKRPIKINRFKMGSSKDPSMSKQNLKNDDLNLDIIILTSFV